MSHARDVAEVITHALVDDPDAVRVEEAEHRGVSAIDVFVAAEDIGRLIGRQGRTVSAMRTLVSATAEHHGHKASLEVHEPDDR